jgi:hypothetical protein
VTQIREQVWRTTWSQQLVGGSPSARHHRKRSGLVDWVRGENPPEDLRRGFVDSTGQFRRDMYEQFLATPNQFVRDPEGRDPDFGSKWLKQYETNLRQRRIQEKLQSVVLASVRVTEGEIRERFVDQSQRYTALYAPFDAAQLVPDQDVQISDADLKTYYDENLDQYRVEATRKLQYILFLEKLLPAIP